VASEQARSEQAPSADPSGAGTEAVAVAEIDATGAIEVSESVEASHTEEGGA
jgi:hypothetical protein